MLRYLSSEDDLLLKKAKNYSDLVPVVMGILKRMPTPVAVVCGPISTGGSGSMEVNLKKFEETIATLVSKGINVFGQSFLIEKAIRRISAGGNRREDEDLLLETFYRPVFESGLISRAYFMPDWQTSYGASWEHEQFLRLGIEIHYL